jgi:lysine 6-dehydrogenase
VRGEKVVPREVFHALFEPQVTPKEIRDIAVTHVVARGRKDGRPAEAIVDMVDLYDERTGFRAMERVTGWHAAIAAEMIARGEIGPGAHSVETGIPPERFVGEGGKRGFSIKARVSRIG